MKIYTSKRYLSAWIASLLVFISAGLGSFKRGEAIRDSLNVMSFNIRFNNPMDGNNSWINRKRMVGETIRFHKVDIAGLQEALDEQVNDLKIVLSEYAWFGVGRDDGMKDGEYNPIFYRKSRFNVLHQSTFWLSETPEKPGIKGWDAACSRIVTWGKIEDRATNMTFFVFNTHFDHVGEKARIKSVELLLERIDRLTENEPIILTGDLNCTEIDPPYKILTSGYNGIAGLSDVHHLSNTRHYGSTQTFNGFKDEIRPHFRIDFIFVRNIIEVVRHGVISDKWDGKFVSDHFPVLTEIVVNKR